MHIAVINLTYKKYISSMHSNSVILLVVVVVCIACYLRVGWIQFVSVYTEIEEPGLCP